MSAPVRRYLCLTGHVFSARDGQRHMVPAHRLPDLYGVDRGVGRFRFAYSPRDTAGLSGEWIVLRPDSTGRYVVPEPTEVDAHDLAFWWDIHGD